MTEIPQDELLELRKHQIKTLREQLARCLSELPDDQRLQIKYETMIAIMQGESGNKSAQIWATALADFALALMNMGFNPRVVLANLKDDAEKFLDQKLKEQSMTLDAPKGTRPN